MALTDVDLTGELISVGSMEGSAESGMAAVEPTASALTAAAEGAPRGGYLAPRTCFTPPGVACALLQNGRDGVAVF